MAKKKKLEPSVPSKAYLVSFGDTMTALLAFFIVLNSLAKEQTGANMYSGTGSFAKAFAGSGVPGGLDTNRSSETIKRKDPKPVYALPDSQRQDEEGAGPDESISKDRVIQREHEDFQRFLQKMSEQLNLETLPEITDQIACDSFHPIFTKDDKLSPPTLQLLSESIAKIRQPNVRLEVIVWAKVPSKENLDMQLEETRKLRQQVEKVFWLKPDQKSRIVYRAKPWLFADAKRPRITVIYSKTSNSNAGS